MGDGLGANCLSRSRWPCEVEGQTEAGCVPLAQSPADENQGVISNLGQRLIKGSARLGRKNDIGEGPLRRDRLDGPAIGTAGEER